MMDRRTFLSTTAVGLLAVPLAAGAQQAGKGPRGALAVAPTPPQAFVSPLPADAPTGRLVTVKASGGDYTSLQAAMNFIVTLNQNLNHVIEIAAGLTLTGTVIAPPKTGTGWVTVRSSEWAALPAGTTVAGNAHMATLCAPGGKSIEGCLLIPDGSNGWRFVGIEFKVHDDKNVYAFNGFPTYRLVRVGANLSQLNGWHSPSGPPIASRVSFERCWGHGLQFSQTNKILSLDCKDAQVWDSRWEEAHMGPVPGGNALRQECQAIFLGDGAGPFHIENNFCSAAGQAIFFYQKDNSADWNGMSTSETIPSDAIVRRNHLFCPLRWMNTDPPTRRDPSWDGTQWVVKQLCEFKSGQRVLMEGNLLENLWAGQGQAGQTPGFVAFFTRDIRFQYNKLLNVNAGFYLAAGNPSSDPQYLKTNPHSGNDSHSFPGSSTVRERIAILHNLFMIDNPAVIPYGAFGYFLQYTVAYANGATDPGWFNDIWVEHNTVVGAPSGARAWTYSNAPDQVSTRSTIRSNIFPFNRYGPSSDGRDGGGADASKGFDGSFGTDRTWAKNAMYGSDFGQGSWNPAAFQLFPDATRSGLNADGTLVPGSPLKTAGAVPSADPDVNFGDLGVNFTTLAAKMGRRFGRR
jgi:hypothetical protein